MLTAAGSLLTTAALEKSAAMAQKPTEPSADQLAGPADGAMEEDVKPVLDLAVAQVRKDIETTSQMLSIDKGKFFLDKFTLAFNFYN